MKRSSLLIASVAIACVAGGISPAMAQRPGGFGGGSFGGGGPPSPDRMFEFIDRNQDGQLDASEIQQSFLRDRMGQFGLDGSGPITKAQFSDSMQRLREQMERGGGFRFGGPPPSGGPDPRDSRSGSDERRESSRFGDPGRGEEFRRDDFRRDDSRRDEGRSESSDRRDRGDSSSKSAASKEKKPKPRVTKDLPDDYRDRDQNGDGQIGLYEWDRKAFAQFYELDRNSDGFLTPDELIAAANKRTAKASGMAAGSKSSSSARNGSSRRPSGSSVTSTSDPAKPAETAKPADNSKSEPGKEKTTDATESATAVNAFRYLDQNRDGQITKDEWERSRTTKKKFESAQIVVTLPINQAAFTALYRKTE